VSYPRAIAAALIWVGYWLLPEWIRRLLPDKGF
jgi:hypothetical protein